MVNPRDNAPYEGVVTPVELGLPEKFTGFRKGQFEAAVELASSDARFHLLSAPTGAGKSLIYMAVSRLLDARTLVLVGTKGLQSQLVSDFASVGMVDIKGHGNYPCGREAGGFPPRDLLTGRSPGEDKGEGEGGCEAVREARRMGLTGDEALEACDYNQAVARAVNSNLVVANYAYWLARERVGDQDLLGKFDLLILDEAHTAHDWLAKSTMFTTSESTSRQVLGVGLPDSDDSGDWVEWAREGAEEYRSRHHGKSHTELERVVEAVDRHGMEWIIQRRGGMDEVYLTLAWAHPYAEEYLFRDIPKVVMASATLSESTGRYMGLVRDEFDYHEVDSNFLPSRRPFIYIPTTRVDYKMVEGQKRIWANKIDKVIDGRLDRKGIVHTVSYERAREVYERSRHRDIMIVHPPGDVQKAVARFKRAAAPCVLVTPAAVEGFDFPGDTCRYQIVAKVPFVYTGDPILKARVKSEKGYGNYLASQALVQMAGRAVRSREDWAETVLIDDNWLWFRKGGKGEFPDWFKKAWGQTRMIPSAPSLDSP